MVEIVNQEDVEKFKELSKVLAGLYGIPPIEIRTTITISGSGEIINTYKLEMLRGKDWIELYLAIGMPTMLKTMENLIDFERKKKKLTK